MISKRLFGSELLPEVKKKLEDRQKVAAGDNSAESIFSHFQEGDNKLADLSSRTPIIRMWTAVSLVDPEVVAEIFHKIEYEQQDPDPLNKNYWKKHKAKRDAYAWMTQNHPGAAVTTLEDPNNPGIWHYYIKENLNERPEVQLATKIYTLGNNNLPGYGENPNESLGLTYDYTGTISSGSGTGLTDEEKEQVHGVFSQELKINQFLKPAAGIISVNTETTELLGVIRKTTINFEVHNFQDFDNIYNRYFMKPGATVFVDYGWSTHAGETSTLYNPKDLLDSPDKKNFLFGELDDPISNPSNIEGVITKAKGDFEVITGLVTNFNTQINHNGSVQCTLELTSANNALMDFAINTRTTRKIQNILDYTILYLAVYGQLQSEIPFNFNTGVKYHGYPNQQSMTKGQQLAPTDVKSDLEQFSIIPDATNETFEIQNYIENLKFLARRTLGARHLLPKDDNIRTGVFVSASDTSDCYICWGLIEDLIINKEFGHGESMTDIINGGGKNLQIRMDSAESFTFWDSTFKDKQRCIYTSAEGLPSFIMPSWWGGEDESKIDKSKYNKDKKFGSYNFQMKKSPSLGYDNVEPKDMYKYDINKERIRIPIREVFISTQLIIDVFNENNDGNVKKVLKSICQRINEDSGHMFKWTLKIGETESELGIVDMNYLETQNKIIGSGEDNDGNNIAFRDMFTFDVTSPHSIVTNYNIDFNLGENDIGNMYAINALSHGSTLLPMNDIMDNLISIHSMDEKNLSIRYQPDLSDFRAEQLGGVDTVDAGIIGAFQLAKDLLNTNTGAYNINVPIGGIENTYEAFLGGSVLEEDIIEGSLFHPLKNAAFYKDPPKPGQALDPEEEKDKEGEASQKRQMREKLELARAESLGFTIAPNFNKYFQYKFSKKLLIEYVPTLLPITLNISFYGISSIQPGDTFRTNYLPDWYRNKVFFQTMKVTQELNTTGWITNLETQFRLRPDFKNNFDNIDKDRVIVHPSIMAQLPLEKAIIPSDVHSTGRTPMVKKHYGMSSSYSMTGFWSFCREITITAGTGYVDMVVQFEWQGSIEDTVDAFGEPQKKVAQFNFPFEYSENAYGGTYHGTRKDPQTKSRFVTPTTFRAANRFRGWGVLMSTDSHDQHYTSIKLETGKKYEMLISGKWWIIKKQGNYGMSKVGQNQHNNSRGYFEQWNPNDWGEGAYGGNAKVGGSANAGGTKGQPPRFRNPDGTMAYMLGGGSYPEAGSSTAALSKGHCIGYSPVD